MTEEKAYRAMLHFLDGRYRRLPSDELGSLLSDLSLDIWSNGMPGDPAVVGEWDRAVALAEQDRLPSVEPHPALRQANLGRQMSFSSLAGQELKAVCFVEDFLELRFADGTLTLYAWPEIFREEGSYAFGEPGYRDMLCGEIGEDVSEATLEPGEALEIQFQDGVVLRLSLREEDLDVTEAGQFETGGEPPVVF